MIYLIQQLIKRRIGMYGYETIKVEINGDIALVKFNRPKALNALNGKMTVELGQAFDELAEDKAVRGIILTGEGRAFMAGADISEMKDKDAEGGREFCRASNYAYDKIVGIAKPVIAAVNGFALGGGLEAALCCDWRIAAESASFAAPEITLGIIPSGGGTQRLPRLIGSGRAKELIFTGRRINAAEAERIGLVNRVVADDELMEEALKDMRLALANSAVALRYAKEAVDTGLNMALAEGIKVEINAAGMVFGSEDRAEGVSAFLKKRKAVFKDK